jgi:uncharacterized RDD family membrane protein YckC
MSFDESFAAGSPEPLEEPGSMTPLVANTSQRIVSGIVDVAPLLVVTIALTAFVTPFDVGATLARLVAALGLLLKDVTGASPGKWLVGVRVLERTGAATSAGRRLLRNVTLAAAPLLAGMPYLGRIAAVVCIVEMVLVLAQKERLGDRLAGTTVVRRAVLSEISAAQS